MIIADGTIGRTTAHLCLAAILCVAAAAAHAQVMPRPSSAPPAEPDASSAVPASQTQDDAESSTPVALSASQIISILQRRPEVMIEMKDLLAQTERGDNAVQADAITDEAVYGRIIANKDLRQNITLFLRARGYVSDEDLQRGRMQSQSALDMQRLAVQGESVSDSGQLQQAPASQRLDAQGASPLTDRSGVPLQQATSQRREEERVQSDRDVHDSAEEPQVLRRPAPYNLASLRDLYTQIPDASGHLKRFGSEVFVHHETSPPAFASLDVPIGPDYVLGPGDGVTIEMWGGISQTLSRTVAADGHLALPEAGDIQIAGLKLEKARELVQQTLKRQYRNVQVSVSLSRLRTIRIYVVGDVQRPGAYEMNSLASPLSALFAAGGPTAVGSLRILKHQRGTQVVDTIDLYDFLLHGLRSSETRLEAGDTLVVPPAGAQVWISGAVKRPAIYELKAESSLAAVLADAGGASVSASLEHISVERINANQHRETISISAKPDYKNAVNAFQVMDGDRVYVAQIAPYSERIVYVEGHVVRPGRHPFRDGMHLNDLLASYQDLLPEPAAHGEIVRLVPPDLHVQTIDFNLPDVLIGNDNLSLQPFDTVRVFGRYDVDAPRVEIRGEVLRAGSYPLSEGMTAAQLVRMAGGFKRDALVEKADLISYRVVNGTKVESLRSDVRIGDAVARGDATADRELKAGDVITIHQITGWSDIGASITIEGEVAHPGSYGFQEGERLSDVLRRAGGFRDTAYPAGAVLVRDQVRELEEKSRVELIKQIETSAAAARLSPNVTSADQSGQAQMIQQQQEQILSRLKNQPATGRLVIHISADIEKWAGTSADIEVRSGDVLRIPKRPGFVLVSGQVYNASAITFTPGRTAGWYLQHAGGATTAANRKEVFVIRANGSVVGRRSGEWYDHDVLSTRLQPGDVVVVPQKIIGASLFWRNLLSTAQIASSIAITAAVAGI